jgi:hypothetical protein
VKRAQQGNAAPQIRGFDLSKRNAKFNVIRGALDGAGFSLSPTQFRVKKLAEVTINCEVSMATRGFSMGGEAPPPTRNIDHDAPQSMRQEILDVAFSIAEHSSNGPTPDLIYRIVSQLLGIAPSGNPYSGFRYAAGRDIRRAAWPRVYDLILRLASEFDRGECFGEFQQGINEALAGNGVVWDLSDGRRLIRVLPSAAQQQVGAAMQELSAERFAPALQLFVAARDAYDDRPRRDRDACSNAFDALESVAKEKQGMPTATLGQVIANLESGGTLNAQMVGVLRSINALRNNNFGHGMTTPFNLTGPEVDFTYLACIAGILLLARMSLPQ